MCQRFISVLLVFVKLALISSNYYNLSDRPDSGRMEWASRPPPPEHSWASDKILPLSEEEENCRHWKQKIARIANTVPEAPPMGPPCHSLLVARLSGIKRPG